MKNLIKHTDGSITDVDSINKIDSGLKYENVRNGLKLALIALFGYAVYRVIKK